MDELSEVKTMNESILGAVHETAKGLHKVGVMKLETMREFDALCIPPAQSRSGAPSGKKGRYGRASSTTRATEGC